MRADMTSDTSKINDSQPPVLDYQSAGVPLEAEPGEQVFLVQPGVLITNVRLVFGRMTFVLDQVVCCELRSDVRPAAEHVLPCIVALGAVVFGIAAAMRSGFVYA